jgi:WD40 repeat protein
MYKESRNKILDKTVNKNNTSIASNYWRIPDDELHLTSVAVNKENSEQVAISSGKNHSNLFIYDINYDDMALTHQQTISLPYIESMQWLNHDTEESTLLTGHRNGTVHIVSIPDSNSEESASIVKRFNHKKHFTSNRLRSLSVQRIAVPNWIANRQNFLSSCNESIFLWDIQHRSDLPILKTQHIGLLNFDASLAANGIVALCGEFGIALNDLRASPNSPSIFTPRQQLGSSNCIKWAPYDSNVIAASHVDGIVRLWDIRAQSSFGKLEGHNDMVTCLEWSEESASDLYTGGKDGSIIHWDLNFSEDLSDCCLREGLNSIKYMGNRFLTDDTDIYANLKKRQCGTLIPAAKTAIVDMSSTDNKILSIDSSAFLGVHDKRGVDSFTAEEGTSDAIMDEMLHSLPELHTSDDESLNDQAFDITPGSTAVNSPMHAKQNSITNLQNGSLDTLVDPMMRSVERRTSGSTLNSDHNEAMKEDVRAAFTYEEIAPLGVLMRQELEGQLVLV